MKVKEAMEKARLICEVLPSTDADRNEIIDNECDLPQLLDWAMKKDAEFLEYAQMNQNLSDMYKQRSLRMAKCSSSIRELLMTLMRASERQKHKGAYGTLSVGSNPQSVIITDKDKLPAEYIKTESKPIKSEIKKALQGGAVIEGASLSNGGEKLTIRRN